MPKDLVQAHGWWNIPGASGHEEAKKSGRYRISYGFRAKSCSDEVGAGDVSSDRSEEAVGARRSDGLVLNCLSGGGFLVASVRGSGSFMPYSISALTPSKMTTKFSVLVLFCVAKVISA